MVQATPAENLVGAASGAFDAVPAARPASALGQFAWAVFDGGRSPYNALVNIFVFSAYFSTVVIPDAVRGQTAWSFVTSTAALLVAIGAPILGAIADAGGRRKPWIAACVILGVPAMCALWFATPSMTSGLGWIIVALIGGTLTFEYSAIFCNAMLPNVAPPGRIGFLSGLGFALGNFFGIGLFVFFLLAWSWNPHPLFGLDAAQHQPERAVGILAAICLFVFFLPLLFFTPDSAGTSRSIPQAVSHGLRSLVTTISQVGRYRNTATFLVARMIFNEGFVVLMVFTGVLAAGILHWNATMLIAEGLINSVLATLAALAAGWLDTRLGSKKTTMLFVACCLLANLALCSITPDMVFFVHISAPAVAHTGLFPTLPDKVFLVTQALIAVFVTGGLVSSRSLMAKVAPPAMLNEFFGLYAMSGTATAFVGPLAIGILTAAFHSQRAGVAVGIVFLLVGLLGMIRVREDRVGV